METAHEPEQHKPTLLQDLPVDVVLVVGDFLHEATVRSLRAASRGFRDAMHNLFVRSCTDELRLNPQITLVSTCPVSMARVAAITRTPAVADAILAMNLHLALPPTRATLPFVAQACDAFDAEHPLGDGQGFAFLRRYHTAVVCQQDNPVSQNALAHTLRAVLGRLKRLTKVRLELFDVMLPTSSANSAFTKYLLLAHWQDAGAASQSTKAAFAQACAAVSTIAERLLWLRIDHDAAVYPGIYATGSTMLWQDHMREPLTNLTTLALTLPGWGLRTPSFDSGRDLCGAAVVTHLLQRTPCLESLVLSGTPHACLDPSTIAALSTELRAHTLKLLHLRQFIATPPAIEHLLSSQSATLRELHLADGAVIDGSWLPLLRGYPSTPLHLHRSRHSHLFDLHAAGFDCIGFPSYSLLPSQQPAITATTTSPSPSSLATPNQPYTQPPCAECGRWSRADRDARDRVLDRSIRCSKNSEYPYNTSLLMPYRGHFTPPSFAIQEYACQRFRLHSVLAALRARQKRVFGEDRPRRAARRVERLLGR